MMQPLTDTSLHVILPQHGFQHSMASNIFLGISACSGSASASLLKETGEVCNQGQSLESLSPGSYILYDDHYDNYDNFFW